jgi:phage shock protein A
MRHQLATMRAQVQKFAISPALDDDMRALERMEEQADQAYAESQAMGDVAAIGDDAKLLQVRKAARKQRAQTALDELKSEMGLSDTEKRFKKVSDEIKPEQQVQAVETPVSPAPQPQPQEQQQVTGTDQTGS